MCLSVNVQQQKNISELFNMFLYAKTAISCQILTIFDHILKGFGHVRKYTGEKWHFCTINFLTITI